MSTTKNAKAEKYAYLDARRRKVWNFIWLNVLSIGAMLLLFYGVLYGDFLTGAFTTTWGWLSRHQVVMALCASTPFFAALLVGRASAAKAKRKRMVEQRRLADEEAAAARRAREERRARESRPDIEQRAG